MTRRQHVAWVSVGQFDPRLGVGGLRSSLARQQFLQARGHAASILDFLAGDGDHAAFDQALIESGGGQLARDGNACRTVFRGLGYRHEVLPAGWEQLMSQPQPAVGAVRRCLQQEGVDYALTADEGYWPLLAAYRLQIPGAHFFHTLADVRRFARNPGYVWLLRRRTTVVSSRFMQAEVKTRMGLDAFVWYPFVNLDDYRFQRDGERRGRIGFYSSGRGKGGTVVAQIAARMPEREFLVVGTYGEERADNVTCWGYVPDMRRFYEAIDILLVPSMVEEAFGRVILEAAASGIPAVANRVGGIPEALGDSGILIDWERGADIVETAGEYVDAIRRMDDDGAYRQYGIQALARAEAYEKERVRASREFCRCCMR